MPTTKNKLLPFIEIYYALITTSSISATEEALDQSSADLITLLADWFKDLGFNVEVQLVPRTCNKFNILTSRGQGAGGLLLAGHTDTVPLDDGRQTRDSLTLTEHDGKLYGLGTADMKGFSAFILDALHDVDVMRLKKPLYILAAADEETSVAGARYFAETTASRPDRAVIGEPTPLQPVRAHKGHISNAIRIWGQSGHPSDPAHGVNAIELMHDAIGYILQLCDSLRERYHYEAFTVPYPTFNSGRIYSDDAPNCVCACCELHMGIRPLPGITPNEFSGLPNDALAPMSERWPGCLTVDELYPPTPGYECPPNHQLIEVVKKLLGVRTEVVNYCTEAPFIQMLYPTLMLGLGSTNQAHQPDEYLEIQFIKPTHELITRVIYHFCWY